MHANACVLQFVCIYYWLSYYIFRIEYLRDILLALGILIHGSLVARKITNSAALPNEPLVTLSVILPSAQLPHMAILRIPAIFVHWTYVGDGPWLPDNLEITVSDGSEQFTEIQAPSNGDNGTARKFRFRNPRLSKRTGQMECQLVSSDSTTGPLVSPLPSPTPNILPRPIPGSDAFEILIYVTVLAKGGS